MKNQELTLYPPEIIVALGELYKIGARRYADRNWEKGMDWGQAYSALQRHLLKWLMGEEIDPETGSPHLVAATWNCITLYTYSMRGVGTDTRAKKTAGYEKCLIK